MLEIPFNNFEGEFHTRLSTRFRTSSRVPVEDLLIDFLISHFREVLDNLKNESKITNRGVTFKRKSFRGAGPPQILADLAREEIHDIGYFEIRFGVLGDVDRIKVIFPDFLQSLSPVDVKRIKLKTKENFTLRIRSLAIDGDVFKHVMDDLGEHNECEHQFLYPYVEQVWNWAIQFICLVCGKKFYCDCFKDALDKRKQNAEAQRSQYSEEGWPHKFLEAYSETTFRENICHLCGDHPSSVRFCHPMYGSPVMVHYGPYIYKFAQEDAISHRDAENKVRDLLGIPRIGEGWISEMELVNFVKSIFPDEDVLHQASPTWLNRQRFDVYVPSRKIAIEYQGRQHYEPVEFFGGEEGFKKTKERDELKAKLCLENGVNLIYFRFNEELTQKKVKEKLAAYL